jgi:type II secretory pathway pseudopilin PulG
MKPSLASSRLSKLSSFTLVELLVVIGIIAILAVVILSAGTSALRAAQRAKALNMATQIQTATLGYYTEYSVYPIPSTATAGQDYYTGSVSSTDWKNIAWSLCGNVSAYDGSTQTPNVANAHAIAFLSLRRADVDANGIPLNPINPNTAANPYFNIAMDGNYDGLLGNNGTASGAITNFSLPTMLPVTISQGVAVWANCNTGSGMNNTFYVHTY